MFKQYKIVYLCVVVAFMTSTYGVAEASHSWGTFHWARSANPLMLNLGDNVSSAWDTHLNTASTDWSVSTVLDTIAVPGNTNNTKGRNTPKSCTPTAGRAEICNAKYGYNGWLGIASVWASGNHITQGTVKLNDTYFNQPAYNTPAWKLLVMCQEIGHVFGLDHQDENTQNAPLGSCMDYTNDPTPNQHPNTHDYSQLETIYSHLELAQSTTTVSPNSQRMLDHDDASTWGREIRHSSDRRTSVFERDFGHDQKVFTFVTWAE